MKKKLMIICAMLVFLTSCIKVNSKSENSSEISLVDGKNLVTVNEIAVSEEITNYEELISSTIEYVYNATICVLNYQTVKSTYIVNSGPWPSYSTKEEHILYGMGSGVIYYKALTTNGDYLYKVITNEHVVSVSEDDIVISGEEEYKIYDERYNEEINCELLGADAENDIAVLSFVSAREYTAISFANRDDVVVGRGVISMGTPLDVEYYNTATYGIISRVSEKYIQHDAAINSGNSGGPLFNIYGNLIGINNAKLSGSTSNGVSIEGIYFAIPLDMVIESIIDITNIDDINYVV